MSKERRLIGVMRIADRLGCGPATVRRKSGIQKDSTGKYLPDPNFPKPFVDAIGEWKFESEDVEAYIDGLKARHVA